MFNIGILVSVIAFFSIAYIILHTQYLQRQLRSTTSSLEFYSTTSDKDSKIKKPTLA